MSQLYCLIKMFCSCNACWLEEYIQPYCLWESPVQISFSVHLLCIMAQSKYRNSRNDFRNAAIVDQTNFEMQPQIVLWGGLCIYFAFLICALYSPVKLPASFSQIKSHKWIDKYKELMLVFSGIISETLPLSACFNSCNAHRHVVPTVIIMSALMQWWWIYSVQRMMHCDLL